jgi:hypothetical protein
MEASGTWIDAALRTLSCSESYLTRRLGVSGVQMMKWRNGEAVSPDVAQKLRKLICNEPATPELVSWAGSIEDAAKWDRLIRYLVQDDRESARTEAEAEYLQDDLGSLCVRLSRILTDMGIEPPNGFPKDLDSYFGPDQDGAANKIEREHSESSDELWEVIETNPYSATINAILHSMNNVWGFYAEHIQRLTDDGDCPLCAEQDSIEEHLLELAACKIETNENFAPRAIQFKARVLRDYQVWLTAVKRAAYRAHAPLTAELLNLVDHKPTRVTCFAQAERLGSSRIPSHPDHYMDELLTGMKAIHRVLPAILKRLQITDSELNEFDERIAKDTGVEPRDIQTPSDIEKHA